MNEIIKEITYSDASDYDNYSIIITKDEYKMLGDKIVLTKYKEPKPIARARALWKLFVRHLSEATGYSELYWQKVLKTKSEFFVSCKEPDGSVTREYKSVSDAECSFDEISTLLFNSFIYVKENNIINLTQFEEDYYKLTGKCLI
jgi:hypothetical protein